MTVAERIGADVAVVGAGPAGLAAAVSAATAGRRTVVLDPFPDAGGQYFMRAHPAVASRHEGPQLSAGAERIAAAQRAGVDLLKRAEVYWAERTAGGFRLHAERDGAGLVVDAKAVVVATGAMERALPFPGWTLPGVIGAGAAQRLLKSGATFPGRRVVLAGSGPFLLAVAKTFADAGAPLHAFIEAVRPGARQLRPLLGSPQRVGEAARLLTGLARTGAKRYLGWAVVEALGSDRVEAVRIAPVGPDGEAQLSAARTLEDVDTLCVGFGFRPVIDLTSLLGARHAYEKDFGGWVAAVHAGTGETSVPGLYAAGEATGIGGWLSAEVSGTLAGQAAVAGLGGIAVEPDKRLLGRLSRARSFAAALAKAFPFPSRLADQLAANAIVCRCEDVSATAIRGAIADGARTAGAVKMWTRAGMGPCQGRVCGPAVAALLAAELGVTPEAAGYNRPQLPLRPVPLDVVEACFSTSLGT